MTVDKTWIRAGRKLQYKQPDECQRHGPMSIAWSVFAQDWSMQIEAQSQCVCVCAFVCAALSNKLRLGYQQHWGQQVIQGKAVELDSHGICTYVLACFLSKIPEVRLERLYLDLSWIIDRRNPTHNKHPLFFTWIEQGTRFWIIIFPSSLKASNCIGWQAHTEWYAVMNGVFTHAVLCEVCVCAHIAYNLPNNTHICY